MPGYESDNQLPDVKQFLRMISCAVLLTSGGCTRASSPSAPTFQSTQIAGLWTGFMQAECLGVLPPCVPALVSFVFRVSDARGSYIGSLEAEWLGSNSQVDIRGTAQDDGSVVLTGRRGDGTQAIEVTRFVVKSDPSRGLTGVLEYTTYDPVLRSRRATIVSASAQSLLLPRPFEGSWIGKAIVRGCSGYCGIDIVGQRFNIQLKLAQHDNGTVTGYGYFYFGTSCGGSSCWIPIAGVFSGSTLRLSGELSVPFAMRLSDFKALGNLLGLMSGTFIYSHSNRQMDCEILWLARQP